MERVLNGLKNDIDGKVVKSWIFSEKDEDFNIINKRMIVIGERRGMITLYESDFTYKPLMQIKTEGSVTDVSHLSNSWIAYSMRSDFVGNVRGGVHVVNLETFRDYSLDPHEPEDPLDRNVGFSSRNVVCIENRFVASEGVNKFFYLWDTESEKRVLKYHFEAHEAKQSRWARDMTYSKALQCCVFGTEMTDSLSGFITLDINKGKVAKTYNGGIGYFYRVDYLEEKKTFLANRSGKVELYDPLSGKVVCVIISEVSRTHVYSEKENILVIPSLKYLRSYDFRKLDEELKVVRFGSNIVTYASEKVDRDKNFCLGFSSQTKTLAEIRNFKTLEVVKKLEKVEGNVWGVCTTQDNYNENYIRLEMARKDLLERVEYSVNAVKSDFTISLINMKFNLWKLLF